jgi:hypothetical protein
MNDGHSMPLTRFLVSGIIAFLTITIPISLVFTDRDTQPTNFTRI